METSAQMPMQMPPVAQPNLQPGWRDPWGRSVVVNKGQSESPMALLTWANLIIGMIALILALIIGGFVLWDNDDQVVVNGNPGSKGEEGVKGEKGERGITGIDGAEGITGAKGEKGEADGDKGEKGNTGTDGVKGEQGVVGPDGDKGQKGEESNVADGTTDGNVLYWDSIAQQWVESDLISIQNATQVQVRDEFAIVGPTLPATATDAGTAGQIAWDADFIYVCVATDTWKRVAIATW